MGYNKSFQPINLETSARKRSELKSCAVAAGSGGNEGRPCVQCGGIPLISKSIIYDGIEVALKLQHCGREESEGQLQSLKGQSMMSSIVKLTCDTVVGRKSSNLKDFSIAKLKNACS